jgi:pimeloyl-ACP methyl ester carboxylesterase
VIAVANPFDPYRALARAMTYLAPFQPDPRRALLEPAAGAKHAVTRFEVARGDRPIPALHFRPAAASGATVVYAHGGGTADLAISVPLFEALLARGLGVVSFEFDGFGTNGADLAYPDALACLPAVLEATRELSGVNPERIGVYGLCLGAAFALHAAARAPWLKAMAFVGAPLGLTLTDVIRFSELAGTFHPMAAPVLLDAPSGHVATSFFTPVRFGPQAHHTLFDAGFAPRMDALIRRLDPLSAAEAAPAVPVHIVVGEWDRVVPIDAVNQLASKLPGEVEVMRLPWRNHTTLLYDRRAAEASATFLAERL